MNGSNDRRPLRAIAAIWGILVSAVSCGGVFSQSTPVSDQNIEIETRGPVHEAFADLVSFDPVPGVEVVREPPPSIEEIPPAERPDGGESIWISGYFAFDEDRDDFIWVSGVWRNPPPNHTWIPGYWYRSSRGHTWVQGFWSLDQPTDSDDVIYAAPPPANLEVGPSSPAPSAGHLWTTGTWTYVDTRYVWRPGTWIVADPDWIYVPASYRWTPGGYVFIDGHWDYLLDRRGVLYAPVAFRRSFVGYSDYHYQPSIAIDLGVLSLHLFTRPQRNHYYFGDWYGQEYWDRGIYPAFAFHMSNYGSDPIYQHRRWEHRSDEHAWEAEIHADFYRYRDNQRERPRRTYAAQESWRNDRRDDRTDDRSDDRRERTVMARPARDFSKQENSHVRMVAIAEADRRRISSTETDQRRASSQRASIENDVAARKSATTERSEEPMRARLPKSPVVRKSEPKVRPPTDPVRVPTQATNRSGGRVKDPSEKPTSGDGRKPQPTPAPGKREGGVETPRPERGEPQKRPTPDKPAPTPDKPAPTPKPTRKPEPTERPATPRPGVQPDRNDRAVPGPRRRPEPQLPKRDGRRTDQPSDAKSRQPTSRPVR